MFINTTIIGEKSVTLNKKKREFYAKFTFFSLFYL